VPIHLRQEEEETVKDRGNFIPKGQYPALKGKAIGVLVATKMLQLDGIKEFPLKVEEVAVDLGKRYKKHLADRQKTIAAVLAKAGKDALKLVISL